MAKDNGCNRCERYPIFELKYKLFDEISKTINQYHINSFLNLSFKFNLSQQMTKFERLDSLFIFYKLFCTI